MPQDEAGADIDQPHGYDPQNWDNNEEQEDWNQDENYQPVQQAEQHREIQQHEPQRIIQNAQGYGSHHPAQQFQRQQVSNTQNHYLGANYQPLVAQLPNIPVSQPLAAQVPFSQPLAAQVPFSQPLAAQVPFSQPLAAQVPFSQPLAANIPFSQPLAANIPFPRHLAANIPYPHPPAANISISQPWVTQPPILQNQHYTLPRNPHPRNDLDIPRYGSRENHTRPPSRGTSGDPRVTVRETISPHVVPPTQRSPLQQVEVQSQSTQRMQQAPTTTVKELNDFDSHYQFKGKPNTIGIVAWFNRIEGTFKEEWDDIKKIRRASKHLDPNNSGLLQIKESEWTKYETFKEYLILLFGSKNRPFSLSKWTMAVRYSNTSFSRWMSSQSGVMLVEKTAGRWDIGDLTEDELSIIMNKLNTMVPKRVFASFFRSDKSWNKEKLLSNSFLEILKLIRDDEDMEDQVWRMFNETLPNPDNSEVYRLNSVQDTREKKPKPQYPAPNYHKFNLQMAQISNNGGHPQPNQQGAQYPETAPQRGRGKGKPRFKRNTGPRNPPFGNEQQQPQYQQQTQPQYQQQYQPQYQQQRQNQPYQRGGNHGFKPTYNDGRVNQGDAHRNPQDHQRKPPHADSKRGGKQPYRGNKRGNHYQKRVNLVENDFPENYDDSTPFNYDTYQQTDQQYSQYQDTQGQQAPGQSYPRQQYSQHPKNGPTPPTSNNTVQNVGVVQSSYGPNDR